MKKIIDGRRYDTDAAKLIGTHTTRTPKDPWYCEESLYRKRTGGYFLYARGGPMSRYAKLSDGMWLGTEQIIPMPSEAASKWALENLGMDIEASEGSGARKSVSFTFPESVIERIRRNAFRNGQTMSDYLIGLVEADKNEE